MATRIEASVRRISDTQVEWEVYGTTDLDQLHVHMSIKIGLKYTDVDSHSSHQDSYRGRGVVETASNAIVPWSAKAIGYPGHQLATLNERLEVGEILSSGTQSV